MLHELYLIDNQIRLDIESCIYDLQNKVYKIRFPKKDTIYSYKEERVAIFKYNATYLFPFACAETPRGSTGCVHRGLTASNRNRTVLFWAELPRP